MNVQTLNYNKKLIFNGLLLASAWVTAKLEWAPITRILLRRPPWPNVFAPQEQPVYSPIMFTDISRAVGTEPS
ncbi:hypothetical protein ACTJIJ_20165 [Niabella sp. 22666]|uniref:hypothetical protein n=1 Tax=Niabella sp. 22666 TaxID=3453954 RepID=UPI003F865381